MAEFAWEPASPVSKVLAPGRSGALLAEPGVRLAERRGLGAVLVMARRGAWAATSAAAERVFGAPPPARPAAVFAGGATLVWSGPDQFLVVAPGNGFDDPLAPLQDVFGSAASLSDQSDSRAAIRVSGACARDMLAKVSSLDLHPSVFPVGAAASTAIDHTGVNLWRAPDDANGSPVFDLLVFRSFAASLWRRLAASSAEYGLASDVLDPS